MELLEPLAAYPNGATTGLDEIHYGPNVPGEDQLRLLGNVDGRRVLILGTGAGIAPIVITRRGGKAIVVDPDEHKLRRAGELAAEQDLLIELHQADLAELAFVRGDSIDLALSVHGLAPVENLPRLFRQVHRVLKPDAPVVLSLPHPAFAMLDDDGSIAARASRSYFDDQAITFTTDDGPVRDQTHTIADVFLALNRSGFVLDTLLEPEPTRSGPRDPQWNDLMRMVPSTLIVRARKRGI